MLLAPHAVHAGRPYTRSAPIQVQPVAGRIGIVEFAECDAVCLGCRLAAAMGFGAEISTREEKCTLIPSHDRAWCPLPRSQTRNIPGNASLWTRITPSNDTFPGTRRHRPPYTRPLCATFPGTRRIPFLCNAKGRPTSRTGLKHIRGSALHTHAHWLTAAWCWHSRRHRRCRPGYAAWRARSGS